MHSGHENSPWNFRVE